MSTIIHANIHKAASSWFRDLFRDQIIRPYIKRPILHYETDLRHATYQNYSNPSSCSFPHNSFVTNICCNYQSFKKIPKEEDYFGIFVYRDPRDIIVSTYWSWYKGHPGGHPNRAKLSSMSFVDGVIWTIRELNDTLDIFNAMIDWHLYCHDDRIMKIKYKDFFVLEQERDNLYKLFQFLKLDIPKSKLDQLYDKHKFESKTNNRLRGNIDNNSHFRSGVSGRYKIDLSSECLSYFYDKFPTLVTTLGYTL